jgi:hypothetical protein
MRAMCTVWPNYKHVVGEGATRWHHHLLPTLIFLSHLTTTLPPPPQVLELLTEHLAQWSTSISYPELVHLPCVALRGFIKGCAVERFRRQAKQLVDALERNVAYVGNARDTVSFAPQDLAAAAAFMSGDKERAQVRAHIK